MARNFDEFFRESYDLTVKGLELDDNIKARDGEARCGAFIIDLAKGDILHWIRFEGAVRELFDAAFIPGTGSPMCVGLNEAEMRSMITFDEGALDQGEKPTTS